MASKINKGEILAKFFDDGEYTALFADGAVSAAYGYAAGQQAYAVYQNGEAVTVKDVEKNIKVLEMAAQTGCPVVTFYNSVGAKLAEGLDVLTASAKLNAQIAKVSGVVPQVAVVLGVCGGTSALSAANADVCIMAEGAELFFTAPFTSAAKGDKVADAGSAAAAASVLFLIPSTPPAMRTAPLRTWMQPSSGSPRPARWCRVLHLRRCPAPVENSPMPACPMRPSASGACVSSPRCISFPYLSLRQNGSSPSSSVTSSYGFPPCE